MKYALGLDIGSSSIKSALIALETRELLDVVQSPNSEMDIISRQAGWAEQHPDIWWKHVCLSITELLRKHRINPNEIASIGISYQMHGLVIVDSNQQVLRPAIIWCDSRATPIGESAYKALGQDFCMTNFLNSPGNFTASKLKWIQDNEPEIYNRMHKFMLPGDYIAMKLTGEISTTINGLTEGILWNFHKKTIAKSLLDYYKINENVVPDIVPCFTDSLHVSKKTASELGLSSKTRVSYRAGDQPNNALSLQVLNPGEIAATSGTSGVVYGVVDTLISDAASRINSFAHINHTEEQNRIGALLCINGAGIQYSWMKHNIARENQTYQDMERMMESVPVGSDGLTILPFGNGSERMFQNQNINAHILNIEFNRHSRAHMYRAAVEGVAFSFVHGMQILQELGLSIDFIRVGNDNMFQSKIFSTTIATLLDNQIDMYQTTGAIGAAKASAFGIGYYSDLKEALSESTPLISYVPDKKYDPCFQAYGYWKSMLGRTKDSSEAFGKKQLQFKKKNYILKEELKDKSQKLIQKNLHIDKLISEFQSLKTKIKDLKSAEHVEDLKSIIRQIDQSIKSEQDDNNIDMYQKYLNIPFIKKLNQKFPNLTVEDLRLSYFIYQKLSTKEISQQFSLSTRGVETKRYRLRKKFELGTEISLVEYLNGV